MKIIHYCDAGHGWFAVKRDVIERLGLLDKVSSYSYQRGSMVYLEEDCDATLLCDALEANGIAYSIETKHCSGETSPIRSYERYSAKAPIKRNYLSLLNEMGKWMDDNQESKFVKTMVQIRNLFHTEARYSKAPDTRELRKYAKWVVTVLNMENSQERTA